MKTERLYYDDPYLLEFEGSVLEIRSSEGRPAVVLDRTAFYPTSGGQPHDLGTINGIAVVDCYEEENSGAVIHVLADSLGAGIVQGKIDAARRLDHRQQHSGQHVLSQAFVELFGWPTVSFHLGTTMCTIDLAADLVSRDEATRAEDLANRIVQENRAVAIRYLNESNIAKAGLRKPTERSGEIRVIDIAGYDKSACGGTHVRMTGEIGPILVTRIEQAKKQTRIEFICGNRVLRYARDANRTLDAISQTISVPAFETGKAVKTMWDGLQESRKRIEELELKLIENEAAAFPVIDGFALGVFAGRGLDAVKLLALKIWERPSTVAILVDDSDQIRLVLARSADITVDVAGVLKKVLEKFGGRGGGRPNLAQAGGLAAGTADEVLQFARRSFASAK
jgi:alanyl-tRNA synthetase